MNALIIPRKRTAYCLHPHRVWSVAGIFHKGDVSRRSV